MHSEGIKNTIFNLPQLNGFFQAWISLQLDSNWTTGENWK